MKFYEILLRGDANGHLQGAHIIEVVGGDAKPITEAQWPGIVKGINDAALATALAKTAEMKALEESKAAEVQAMAGSAIAELETIKTRTAWAIEQASTVIADASVNDADTVSVISSVLDELNKDEAQRKRDTLLADIAKKQAELDAIS